MQVTSYGLFWRRDEVEWSPGSGQRGRFKLLGHIGERKPRLKVADFRLQQGIYVLFDDYGPSYVGLTRREKGLGQRLKEHDSDHLKHCWDRFCWFGFKSLAKSSQVPGFYSLADPQVSVTANTSADIGDLEALLIQVIGPKNNSRNMRFQNADEWLQVEHGMYDEYLARLKS